ncbi:MAG TPA: hypothetical protein DEF51_44140 [Myxococcales bacterium]|nr:hypothetical protein [Myxococcales bacterium]
MSRARVPTRRARAGLAARAGRLPVPRLPGAGLADPRLPVPAAHHARLRVRQQLHRPDERRDALRMAPGHPRAARRPGVARRRRAGRAQASRRRGLTASAGRRKVRNGVTASICSAVVGGHSDSDDARLLAFARRLQAFQTFDELIDELCNEVRAAVGYSTAWLAIFDESGERVRIMAIQGDMAERVWERAAVIPVSGDPYMERIRDDRTVQIVEDAQVADDVNRDIVTALGNRTIVNVPLTLIDRPFGAIGTGTFGDEGVRVPSRADLAYLEAMGQQLVMASARILLDQQRKEAAAEREALMRQLEQRQRLESLGRLAGGVAHEFNNLLTVVHGSASLLLLEEDDPEKVEELRVIIDAAERSEQLTRKLLAMGKRQPLRLEVTGLDAIVRDAQALMRPVVPKGVELECSVEEGMRVRVDAAQVEQLLLNLVLNACDAMPEGGRVTVRGDAVELDERFAEEHVWARPGLYAQVVVEDTGVGMEPELLARIFEPFFTTKPEEKGSGLGLANSRGVAEQHGGFLHATSVPGEGSRFALFLPRAAP